MVKFPAIRTGVHYEAVEGGVHFRYLNDSFTLSLDDARASSAVIDVLREMDGSAAIEELREHAVSGVDVARLVDMLHEQRYVDDGRPEAVEGMSGTRFAHLLEANARYGWLRERPSPFSARVLRGDASTESIIGWAIELYHITVRAHDSLAPAAARAPLSLRQRLERFFVEEYRHDKLMRVSLKGAGLSDRDITEAIPLRTTASLMNALSRWARTDVLSFVAALFIFEGTAENAQRYVEALRRYSLPPAFVEGQARHVDINVDEDHGNVTEELLSLASFVSSADVGRVMTNVRRLVGLVDSVRDEVVTYYEQPGAAVPRRLPAHLNARSVDGTVSLQEVETIVGPFQGQRATATTGAEAWKTLAERLFDDIKTSLIAAIRQRGDIEVDEHFSKAFVAMVRAGGTPRDQAQSHESEIYDRLGDALVVLADTEPWLYGIALSTMFALLLPAADCASQAAGPRPSALLSVGRQLRLEDAVARANKAVRFDDASRRLVLQSVQLIGELCSDILASNEALDTAGAPL